MRLSAQVVNRIMVDNIDAMTRAVDWSLRSRDALRLIRSRSWRLPGDGDDPFPDVGVGEAAESPGGGWVYIRRYLPPFEPLLTINHLNEAGVVMFDLGVGVPCLFEKNVPADPQKVDPFMSITPLEVDTLQPGVDIAHGKVVLGGLGLGYQAIEVSKLDRVESIVVVEKSRELADWMWPRVQPLLRGKPCELIVGDAYAEIPNLTADVALLDMFPKFGGNDELAKPLVEASKNIKTFWTWGAGDILPPAYCARETDYSKRAS